MSKIRGYHRTTPISSSSELRQREQGRHISRPKLQSRVGDALDAGSVLLIAGPGYGKTTVLEDAMSRGTRPVAWVACTDTERAAGTLLQRILDAISRAAPGVSDALAERLVAAPSRVDVPAATRELLADLPRLLVEPLSLAIDDAEHLEGANESLRLLSDLIRAELLHVAIATRRPLDLTVAKPRATGRLTEFGPVDLAFDPEECAALLRSRGGADPSADEIEDVMGATEGWPLGVALAVSLADGPQRSAGGPVQIRDLRSAPEVRSFLSEELLDSLEPELREATISSSVAPRVTPEVAEALDLPPEFAERIERAGVLIRRDDDGAGFAYHPLLRELLLERLSDERGADELRRLHGLVAPVVAETGDAIAAIELWLNARNWEEAIPAIEREGPVLARTSPDLLWRWLDLLSPEVRGRPTIRSLEGQLEWGAGDHPRAADVLQDAVSGFRDETNPPADWMARFVLADSLFGAGEYERTRELVQGWDDPAAAEAGVLAPATVNYVAFNLAAIGLFEEADQLATAANRHPLAARFAPIEAIRLAFHDFPRGHLTETYERLDAVARELERHDPFHRRLYLLATMAIVLADLGRTDEAVEMWRQVRHGARGGAGPFLVDTTHACCAVLLAQQGRLSEAEAELAAYEGLEKGWRTHIGHLAEACVASLKGEAAQTTASAETALALAARSPVLFRYWTGADLIPALAGVGRIDRAGEVLESTLLVIDQSLPGPSGRFPRGRLIALRAWLRHIEGDSAGADDDLGLFWKETGESRRHILRREWPRLKEPVWDALERGALEPAASVQAIAEAFPEGLALVPFLEHPVAEVRRAAITPAAVSGDPEAFAQLRRLAEEPDPDLAEIASRATERLARTLPPLRFEVLGGFDVGRGSWRAGDAWGRPVDARLVRFLLANLDGPVPEDLIFEGLWPELSISGARKSLQVAVSRARRVLDPPGAEESVLESAERTYRLALGEHDLVDAERFRSAAEQALAGRGNEQRPMLDHARSLWAGEPMPEERYSDWATGYRERLLDTYTEVLAALIEIHELAGEHFEASGLARELVDLDPVNEGGHRALIAAYARAGRTGYALRQYLECRRALIEQLGIEPSEATTRLQARILAGEQV